MYFSPTKKIYIFFGGGGETFGDSLAESLSDSRQLRGERYIRFPRVFLHTRTVFNFLITFFYNLSSLMRDEAR